VLRHLPTTLLGKVLNLHRDLLEIHNLPRALLTILNLYEDLLAILMLPRDLLSQSRLTHRKRQRSTRPDMKKTRTNTRATMKFPWDS
jgi:hypothetical protein